MRRQVNRPIAQIAGRGRYRYSSRTSLDAGQDEVNDVLNRSIVRDATYLQRAPTSYRSNIAALNMISSRHLILYDFGNPSPRHG